MPRMSEEEIKYAKQAGDHSNSQFAIFALWVGRKQGFPVRNALAAAEQHFRQTQADDGRWGYRGAKSYGETNPSMTCAGLIALAVAFGYANERILHAGGAEPGKPATKEKRAPKDGTRDPAVRLGLLALGSMLDAAFSPQSRGLAGAVNGSAVHRSQNYFLWSLERVAVAFSLDTIGNKDWYARGSETLLSAQEKDGSWSSAFCGAVAETSFALLFLRRANLAPDLSATLKTKIDLRAGSLAGDKPKAKNEVSSPGAKNVDPSRPRLSLDFDRDSRNNPSEIDAARRQTNSPEFEAEVTRLSTKLVESPPEKQQEVVKELRNNKGVVNTQALAMAIPQLTGSMQSAARDALVERLARMTPATLQGELRADDTEIRRAAALACAMKEDLQHVPDLIALLDDPKSSVARAAHAALRDLTKRDLGPKAGGGAGEREQAIKRWREWWAKQKK